LLARKYPAAVCGVVQSVFGKSDVSMVSTRAVILRRIPFGDTSWILHAFSADEGAISLMARGARRANSPLAGAVEPLGLSEIVVSMKPGRDLQTLSQAMPIEQRDGLRKDLAATAGAMVCAEIVMRLAREPGAHPGVFAVLEQSLGAFDKHGFHPPILWRFLSRFCEEMGWALAVDHCAHCGTEDLATDPVLSLPHGGFLCRACGTLSHEPHLHPVYAKALRESPRGARGEWSRPECERVEEIWFEHLFRHSQTRPKLESRQFLTEVRP
jgi:DNA repair protein RecO (recombination protein O)